MELPQETIVWRLLPALRKEIALELKRSGLSQKDIASRLSLTPAAVSQYLSDKRAAKHMPFNMNMRSQIQKSANAIMKSDEKTACAYELIRLVRISQKERTLCASCIIGSNDCRLCTK